MKENAWITANCMSLKGKTVAITGAAGGLGQEICRSAAFLGCRLLLLNRSPQKAQVLLQQLRREFPGLQAESFPLDLENMGSVNAACQWLTENPPDILLHNAGIYDVPRHLCSNGLDNIFTVNFAAPYYMTRRLLPVLRKKRSHIVVVGSIAHNYAPTDPLDPDFHTRKACHLAYGNSKRFLMFAFSELLKEETEVSFSIGHPGITLTNMSNHYPKGVFPFIRPFLKLLFPKPETACRGILYAMAHPLPHLSWAGPGYFHIWGSPRVSFLNTCTSQEYRQIGAAAERIFENLQSSL